MDENKFPKQEGVDSQLENNENMNGEGASMENASVERGPTGSEPMENALQDVIDEANAPQRGQDAKKKRKKTGKVETEQGVDAKPAAGIVKTPLEKLKTKLMGLSFLKSSKVDFRQPKYYFPFIVLIPLLFLGYTLAKTFQGTGKKDANKVVKDSINMALPAAANDGMNDKMTSMMTRYDDQGGLTAVNGIGEDEEQKDSVANAYLGQEADEVNRANAELARQQKMMEEQQRRMERSRQMAAGYGNGYDSYGSRQSEMDSYRRDLEDIQRRSLERQRLIEGTLSGNDERENSSERGYGSDVGGSSSSRKGKAAKDKAKKETLVVTKLQDANAGRFNTLTMTAQQAESMLIRAMIDKTTKAHEGTRLRFKLLDDVQIKDTKLKKGTYLYGIVTGFGQQRVKASITSILVGDKFLNVNLSVFDNDGMEGFYVPESAFRDMMKEAGAQSMQSNISLNDGYSSELTGEAVALQALQNMYQSASNAVSANIRKNKARIKYNTIVYLINTDASSN